MPATSTAKARRAARKSTPKVARGAARPAAQALRAARKAAPVKALKATGSCTLQLGTGWAHADPPTPIATVEVGTFAHLALRVKAKSGSTPSWENVASIPDWHYRPESGRGHLPCAVRDASAGKWYMALGRVSGWGVVSVEMISASKDGSFVTPFAIGAGDEIHMSFAYYNS